MIVSYISIVVIVVGALIGAFLHFKKVIKLQEETKGLKELFNEAMQINKESDQRSTDSIADVDKRLSEFTRKE
jgi:hypothetical protein